MQVGCRMKKEGAETVQGPVCVVREWVGEGAEGRLGGGGAEGVGKGAGGG